MKIALIHDWLTGMRGGEKVLEAIADMYPAADIFTLLWVKGSVSQRIESHKIFPSFMQYLPKVKTKYRHYLPLMPMAIEHLDLKSYDLIISSSHCVAKGVKKRAGALHVCYCHTPMRYIWDQYDEYFNRERAGAAVTAVMKLVRPYLQQWDIKSANGVDIFVANSHNVKNRIKTYYDRDAVVIYPPVDTEFFNTVVSKTDERQSPFYLMVTALVPYKRVDIAVKAFNELGISLKIIGSGPDASRLKKLAANNIEFLGWQPDERIRECYSACRALVFPQDEDFGITAVEVQACGKPVIAFRKGGALETVVEGKTGVFFDAPTPDSLKKAVLDFEKRNFSQNDLVNNADKFSLKRFKNEMELLINKALV